MRWSGICCDAERIFAYRLLRIARGDETPLAGFDENTYVPAGSFDSRELNALIKEWMATRDSTIALVRGLPADAWTRRGTANGKTVTAASLAYIILGHVEHHLGILRIVTECERVDRSSASTLTTRATGWPSSRVGISSTCATIRHGRTGRGC